MVGNGQICPGPGATFCHEDILAGARTETGKTQIAEFAKKHTNIARCAQYFASAASRAPASAQISSANKVRSTKFKARVLFLATWRFQFYPMAKRNEKWKMISFFRVDPLNPQPQLRVHSLRPAWQHEC